jgi:hypothetical protein
MRGTTCLTILVSTLVSASATAEASESQGSDPEAASERRHWQALPGVEVTLAPPRWHPTYLLLAAFPRTAWLWRWDAALGPTPPILGLQDFERARADDDALAGVGGSINLRPTWPALKYRDEDSHISLTLAPGSPCTGACLKVMGSF